jgi:hypothetical protein
MWDRTARLTLLVVLWALAAYSYATDRKRLWI